MRRSQLEHAIRAACEIIRRNEIIVVGSQAILGSFHEDQLPHRATMSTEIDLLPVDDDPAVVLELSDTIAAVAGEWSMFDETHGFHLDGVDTTTVKLPYGWRERLVRVRNDNTRRPGSREQSTGYCLNKEDLCVAKLLAHRTKDLEFVAALLSYGLIDRDVVTARLLSVEQKWPAEVRLSLGWLRALA